LVQLSPVQVFAASYVDGEGYADTRYVAVMPDGRIHWIHMEGVDEKIRQPAGWLKEQITAQVPSIPRAPVSIPESKVDVPIGGVS